MGRYSAQFRNQVLRKLLPPENRSALSLAKEYNLSVATIYGWKAKMKQGTLGEEAGVVGNKSRPLEEKLTLLLESGRIPEERKGEWLRGNGLHTEHLTVWEQEVREAMRKGVLELREELKAAKKKIKEQERELARKEKALAEMAIVLAIQKKTAELLRGTEEGA